MHPAQSGGIDERMTRPEAWERLRALPDHVVGEIVGGS